MFDSLSQSRDHFGSACDDEYGYAHKKFSYVRFTKDVECYNEGKLERDQEFSAAVIFGSTACKYQLSDITWCNKFDKHDDQAEPCGAVGYYGNDSSEIWYQHAAILVAVPKWSNRCSTAEQEGTAANTGIDMNCDLIERCFKDLDSQKLYY